MVLLEKQKRTWVMPDKICGWMDTSTHILPTYIHGSTPKSRVIADDTTYIISWETWVVYITGVNTEHRDD